MNLSPARRSVPARVAATWAMHVNGAVYSATGSYAALDEVRAAAPESLRTGRTWRADLSVAEAASFAAAVVAARRA